MTADELKSIPRSCFIVMKTGIHPIQTRLRLYPDWGITFGKPYILPEKSAREATYTDELFLSWSIMERSPSKKVPKLEVTEQTPTPYNTSGGNG